MFGFYRCAACVPVVKVADPVFNLEQIFALAEQAGKDRCAAVLFPELALTASSCGDLFRQPLLLDAAERAAEKFAVATRQFDSVFAVGCPVRVQGKLFNTVLFYQHGKLLGIVPKTILLNDQKRCFTSGSGMDGTITDFAGFRDVPFGTDLLFTASSELTIAAEIGEDADSTIPPCSYAALAGATLLLTAAASSELAGKAEYRKRLLAVQSARCAAASLYASAGVHESTSSTVCGGHCFAVQNGAFLFENERFGRTNEIHYADFDLARIAGTRLVKDSFTGNPETRKYRRIALTSVPGSDAAFAQISRTPFIPEDPEVLKERCAEVFAIQSAALAKRMEHAGAKKAVLGISGGLDSTLALLVCINTMKLLNRPASDIVTVTMPGFGTTGRTYDNAVGLCRELGTELREIRIVDACLQHFKDIGHDPEVHDVVYENSQARERTQILHDLANQEGGICIGTGDLSEAAMGWCTFAGDQIAMYGVNASVPKTLIRPLIAWVGKQHSGKVQEILQDIIETPVSPELLPATASGEIAQKTEDIIGPYEIHDFFLYHFLKYGAEPAKLLFLAGVAFGKEYPEEKLRAFLKLFLRRFFTQQFKRSCSPDSPSVGSISLSPHGDWKMPSDAAFTEWISGL